MKFAIVTLGSAGDLHPFLAIARALVERGHEVHLLTQAPYESEVRAEGVDFFPVATQDEHERTLRHPLLWHPLHGFGVLWRHLAVPAIGPTLHAIDLLSASGSLTVLASPLAAGARLARELWPGRVRLLSGYTAPMGLRSTSDPMFMGSWRVPSFVPRGVRSGLWKALDRWKLEPMAQPAMRQWTHRLALPPFSGSLFGEALHSPDGGVALFPPWFASVPLEWARRGVRQTGFPVFEPTQTLGLGEDVVSFLDKPTRFAVVYPGSADRRAESVTGPILAACRELDLRALVLSRFGPQGATPEANTLWTANAPLRLILPAASAFIHHGGIGSIAQAFVARAPQLILASAYDQFENGTRVEQLHRGRWLQAANASAKSVRGALEELSAMAKATVVIPLQLASLPGRPNQAVQETCNILEDRKGAA
ncbi:glycosyltransferase [Ideonella sp. YS5]|uniref:glycosyltransferase n=1 Tax=Ideonella sp. YS5 TaxID=3453714 RepID=UPI003EF02C86